MQRNCPTKLRRCWSVFPDFPNVHTYGEDEGEAAANAADALETMLSAMIDDRDEILESTVRLVQVSTGGVGIHGGHATNVDPRKPLRASVRS